MEILTSREQLDPASMFCSRERKEVIQILQVQEHDVLVLVSPGLMRTMAITDLLAAGYTKVETVLVEYPEVKTIDLLARKDTQNETA